MLWFVVDVMDQLIIVWYKVYMCMLILCLYDEKDLLFCFVIFDGNVFVFFVVDEWVEF